MFFKRQQINGTCSYLLFVILAPSYLIFQWNLGLCYELLLKCSKWYGIPCYNIPDWFRNNKAINRWLWNILRGFIAVLYQIYSKFILKLYHPITANIITKTDSGRLTYVSLGIGNHSFTGYIFCHWAITLFLHIILTLHKALYSSNLTRLMHQVSWQLMQNCCYCTTFKSSFLCWFLSD